MNKINNTVLKDALLSAANHLSNHRKEINDLNIFPVPDGDTGTNMSMTIQAAAVALQNNPPHTAGETASLAASAMLRGAKGNSGVILSLLCKGIAEGAKEKEFLTGADLVHALGVGVDLAYKTVSNPTEGTILTVARVAWDGGRKALSRNDGVLHVWEAVCKSAQKALEETPDQLPVLKRAGVVDAGGKGLCLIFEGMRTVFAEGRVIELAAEEKLPEKKGPAHIGDSAFQKAAAAFDGDIQFTYCTECILNRAGKEDQNPEVLRRYLTTIGDCVVVVADGDILKLHVHTDAPGKVLQKALDFGALSTVKVDNMREQAESQLAKPAEPTGDYGFVAVAAGDGLCALFGDLGCAQVVRGGQTMNPSTEELYRAVMATPAKTVFLLPNNKNILLAAKQAAALVEDRQVVVLPTRSVPEGISALIAFSSTRTPEDNETVMLDAARHVKTGQVTFAARDSKFGATKIKSGDLLGLIDGRMTLVEKEKGADPAEVAVRLTRSMMTKETKFVTLFYGMEVTAEQAAAAAEKIKAKAGKQVEVNLAEGGQPVYYYLISVE